MVFWPTTMLTEAIQSNETWLSTRSQDRARINSIVTAYSRRQADMRLQIERGWEAVRRRPRRIDPLQVDVPSPIIGGSGIDIPPPTINLDLVGQGRQ